MAQNPPTRAIEEEYFLTFGKSENTEEIRKHLNDINCKGKESLYFWPEDLATFDLSNEEITSAIADVLQVLPENPEKITKVLKPSKAKFQKWNHDAKKKKQNRDLNLLAEEANKGCCRLYFVEGNDYAYPVLMMRIDNDIDPDSKIRKMIEDLLVEKQLQFERQEALEYSELTESPGSDRGTAKEDDGKLHESYANIEILERLPERAYYPSQIALANQVVDRIEAIYKHYHEDRKLSDFDSFDFCIYTANTNMLEDQTCARLSKIDSECFPKSLYEGSDVRARRRAREKVFKYNSSQAVQEHHHDLQDRVIKEPKTLFLIIADEAHWGATEKEQANSTLVNIWNTKDHPNVIVLLVTATPYNLLTENKRLLDTLYKYEENGNLICWSAEEISRNTDLRGYKMLHHIKWSESFPIRVKEGIIVTLRVPLPGIDKPPAQLCIEKNPNSNDNMLPWEGFMLTQDFSGYESEFVIQGNDEVTITTVDGRWTLVVKDNGLGFIKSSQLNKLGQGDISKFRIIVGYGEGLFLLKVNGLHGRDKLLYYNKTSKKIELRVPRSSKGKSPFEVPPLESSFLLEKCRPIQCLAASKEYISLNYYINSMRNEDVKDQLIRDDLYYQEMVKKRVKANNTKTNLESCILTSEYSYYILVINLIRAYPLKVPDLNKCFENLCESAGEYPQRRTDKIDEFQAYLSGCKQQDIHPIDTDVFKDNVSYLSNKVQKEFERDLKEFNKRPNKDTAEELLKSVVASLMHLNPVELGDIQEKLNENENCRTNLKDLYRHFLADFSFEDISNAILLESETGCIVNNLIPKESKTLDGNMTVIRVTKQEYGNMIYKTLCIARKMSSDIDYSFEILRDYTHAKLCDDFSDKLMQDNVDKNRQYRVRLRLQPKRCTYVNPQTFERCQCNFTCDKSKVLRPNMECMICNHKHKKIESYTDLEGLPCILILIRKGSLGDTFPSSFSVMDLRLTYKKNQPLMLSRIVQELGRLCRYQIKSHRNPLPYVLIGEHLANALRRSLHVSAAYYGLLKLPNCGVQLDGKVVYKEPKQKDLVFPEDENQREKVFLAKKDHFDYENKEKHSNRLLLEAEPQIGKTGVYMKVISILHQLISPEPVENEIDSEDEDDADEENENIEVRNDASQWVYPYWRDMEGPNLKKSVQAGKYPRIYGKYNHGNAAPEVVLQNIFNQENKRKKQKDLHVPSKGNKIKAYNFRDHSSCEDCFVQYENSIFDIVLPIRAEHIAFRMSVPITVQYDELLKYIQCYTEENQRSHLPEVNRSRKVPEDMNLRSWIFIPSYNRCDSANVNLYHTMVKENGSHYEQCQYTAILVVRSTDFQAYCQRWQSTHAILQIPDELPKEDRDVYEGGIGFARLAIQLFAEHIGLSWIFMLDDIIPYAYEIQESGSAVQRKQDRLVEKPVSLFKVLKHIEKQIDGSVKESPAQKFDKYTDEAPEHPLEEYTGVRSKYGILGVKKYRGTSSRVKRPFAKVHVHSLVFLNIKLLKDRNIYYKPWQVYEDLTINNDCDDKQLWVCKYNRFTIFKLHMNTWYPRVFLWTEKTCLNEAEISPKYPLDNSIDILIKYLQSVLPIKQVIELPTKVDNEVDGEFNNMMKQIEKLREKLCGKHVLFAIRNESFEQSTKMLRDYFDKGRNFGNGSNYFVMMMTSDFCIEKRMTSKSLIGEWLKTIFNLDFKWDWEVVTSHNVGFFSVKILLVIVKVSKEGAGPSMQTDNAGDSGSLERKVLEMFRTLNLDDKHRVLEFATELKTDKKSARD